MLTSHLKIIGYSKKQSGDYAPETPFVKRPAVVFLPFGH